MNIARDACGIRTTSSPRVKLMSSLAFDPRFFSPCNCVNSDKKVRDRIYLVHLMELLVYLCFCVVMFLRLVVIYSRLEHRSF